MHFGHFLETSAESGQNLLIVRLPPIIQAQPNLGLGGESPNGARGKQETGKNRKEEAARKGQTDRS